MIMRLVIQSSGLTLPFLISVRLKDLKKNREQIDKTVTQTFNKRNYCFP